MSETVTAARPIDTITAEILVYKGQAGSAILEIGRRLIEAKNQLEHGAWTDWLRERVDFSERSAQNFMRLAQEYPNPQTFADLGASKALALLAVPADERERFAAEADARHCSVRDLQEAIKAREAAENQAKGWALKCEQAKADADAARAAAKKQEQDMKLFESALEKAKEAKKKLAARVKELECQPKEVAVKDAAPEQLAAAAAQAKAEAQQVIDALRAELKMAQKKAEQVKPMAEEAGRALVEINILFGQIQTAAARIHDQLGTLDEVTRARVTAALASALARVSAS